MKRDGGVGGGDGSGDGGGGEKMSEFREAQGPLKAKCFFKRFWLWRMDMEK